MLMLGNKSWLWVLLLCWALGALVTWSFSADLPKEWGALTLTLFWLIDPILIGVFLFFLPYGFIVLALARLRKRRAEIESLDDTLADVSQEVSNRKLREFIATRSGLESYMGLVERTHAHDVATASQILDDKDPRGLPVRK